MGCTECEVPAAVTRGRGGKHTQERERERGEAREEFGGVLTMRNRPSSWQKKLNSLPITEGESYGE